MCIPWDPSMVLHIANLLTVSIAGWQFKMTAKHHHLPGHSPSFSLGVEPWPCLQQCCTIPLCHASLSSIFFLGILQATLLPPPQCRKIWQTYVPNYTTLLSDANKTLAKLNLYRKKLKYRINWYSNVETHQIHRPLMRDRYNEPTWPGKKSSENGGSGSKSRRNFWSGN